MMMEGEEEQHEQDHDTAAVANSDLQPKRTTSFASRLKNKKKPGPKPVGNDLIARITLEREKTKYWARLLLLFPLCPVIVALTTIVFGGVVINVATNKCNSMLMEFLQGAVVLSHLLVIFYAYSWMGPWPIKRLRTVRLMYFLYGFVCVTWWGIFGTLQAATATSSGFQSCLSSSPALYLMAQYEITVFWILFAIFIGFIVMEKTSKTREAKLNELKEKKLDVLRAKRKAEAQAREESLKAEQELARKERDAEKKKLVAEQDQLFRDSEGEEAANNQLDHDALEDDEDKLDDLLMDPGDGGDDEDDEEVVVLGKKSIDIYVTVDASGLGIFPEVDKLSVVHIKSSHVSDNCKQREKRQSTGSRSRRNLKDKRASSPVQSFGARGEAAMSGGNGQTITVCGNVFRLVETIGRGSYGTVHKAINLSSGAAVAVKLIGKDKLRSPHERRSIEKEIETMRVAVEQFENGHPHIVRLLCTKESQQHIFIVLEYCAGGDLAAVMKASRGLSEVQSRIYLTQLASGLQFLHSQSVVHRDLKPANLLLSSKNEATAKLKIADFGFARELQSESLAESVVGSPLYMAPELLEYKSYDAKADLWSVGIILYEMLVNDHPFLVVDGVHATNHLALRRNIHRYFERNPHVKLPSQIKVSEDCEELLRGLLRIDPRQRISFEDFFRAPFLLPPPPTEADLELTASASVNRQALVAEKQSEDDDLAFSDEYVIVDKEYEDVGRKVLNQNDLKADMGVKASPAPPTRSRQTSGVDKVAERVAELSVAPLPSPTRKDDRVAASSPPRPAPAVMDEMASIVDVVVDTSTPRASDAMEHPGFDSPPTPESKHVEPIPVRAATPPPPVAAASISAVTGTAPSPRDWAVADETRLEELLGICYKSFSCGSVALFVPTPFGDYIAFHEGCPHYYLSIESVEAFKLEDGRNPPFVLGCIVFIEDFVASKDGNPYCLRDGTPYHIATATPLASHASSSAATSTPSEYGDLPMSQALAPRTLAFEPPPAPSSKPSGGFFSSLSSYLGHPTVAEPTPAPAPSLPPPPPQLQTQSSSSSSSHLQNGTSTHHQRISFRSFQISHLALFFLKGGKQTYVAFNDGAPNYYLANESIQAARDGNDDKTNPAYILGEIIFIDTFQATEDFNPYRLPYGTRFHVVTVANPTGT